MTHELQNFLILVCLLVSYPIMPTLAWQEREKHPTLAIVVIALWVFIVPVFVIGFSSTLWAGAPGSSRRPLVRPSRMSRVLRYFSKAEFASATLRVGTFKLSRMTPAASGSERTDVTLTPLLAAIRKSDHFRAYWMSQFVE
jgi:hypothetical protein